MQVPQIWFTIPGLGSPRPARSRLRDHAEQVDGDRRRTIGRSRRPVMPGFHLPVLGPRLLVGLLAGLLVLLPGLIAAELIVRGFEARLTADAEGRAMVGLDGATALVDVE